MISIDKNMYLNEFISHCKNSDRFLSSDGSKPAKYKIILSILPSTAIGKSMEGSIFVLYIRTIAIVENIIGNKGPPNIPKKVYVPLPSK